MMIMMYVCNIIKKKEATNGTWKLLGDSIRRNPDSLFLSNEEAVQKLLTGHYAYYHVHIKIVVNRYYIE